jgi:hypothetical protein
VRAILGPALRERPFVVNLSPCVATKASVARGRNAETVDAVLTIAEFKRLLGNFGIDILAPVPVQDFDVPFDASTRPSMAAAIPGDFSRGLLTTLRPGTQAVLVSKDGGLRVLEEGDLKLAVCDSQSFRSLLASGDYLSCDFIEVLWIMVRITRSLLRQVNITRTLSASAVDIQMTGRDHARSICQGGCIQLTGQDQPKSICPCGGCSSRITYWSVVTYPLHALDRWRVPHRNQNGRRVPVETRNATRMALTRNGAVIVSMTTDVSLHSPEMAQNSFCDDWYIAEGTQFTAAGHSKSIRQGGDTTHVSGPPEV